LLAEWRIYLNFHVLTLFPEMITNGLNTSIIGRALEKGLLTLEAIDIREFSENKHRRVDDYPYGGGAGMVMAPGPVYRAYQHVKEIIDQRPILESKEAKTNLNLKKTRVIYLTPQGRVFNQSMAEELSKEEDLVFLCGHYEGIDERVLEMIVTDPVSIGDYVLTGGELPAMVMIDAISRLVSGVLNNDTSAEFETFQDNLLEYPQYTRPEVFMGKSVPEVLLSGHHAKIDTWRREQSIIRTVHNRPDMIENAILTKKEEKFLDSYLKTKDVNE
jgi:tRNA (guanine37-N1)-methyltransferase